MKRKHLIMACTALVAVAGVYALGRWSAMPASPLASGADGRGVPAAAVSAPDLATSPVQVRKGGPLPPPTQPLGTTFTDLQARANAGDADAARRLVHDLDRCSRLRAAEWNNAGTTNTLLERRTEGMNAAQLRTYQALLDAMDVRRQTAGKSRELCAGVDDKMLGTLVANIAQAARLGDADARACYLGQGPLYDVRSLLENPGILQSYRRDATAMIESGVAAGDWRVVDLLQRAYEPGAQGMLAGMLGPDPAQHYRYLKLYRLGAESHRTAQLDRQIAAVAANLPPEERYEADRWAQTAFKENFNGPSTTATPQGWDACTF
nr:hypothetical protein [Pseudoxanthomonas sp.]